MYNGYQLKKVLNGLNKMKKIFIDINRVLADWDPIGVPKYIAIDEYGR